MALDKVKPLKIETTADGVTADFLPTEADPTKDYLEAQGISFHGLDTQAIDYVGRVIAMLESNSSQLPAYNSNGTISTVSYYNSTSSQITANRVALVTISYSGFFPTTEVLQIFDTDGTTVLRTLTYTYTFTNVQLTNTTVAYT